MPQGLGGDIEHPRDIADRETTFSDPNAHGASIGVLTFLTFRCQVFFLGLRFYVVTRSKTWLTVEMTRVQKKYAGPTILCDYCLAQACRLMTTGSRSSRVLFCEDCETKAYSYLPGRRENDRWRTVHITEIVRALRLQNVRNGKLSPRRFAYLDKTSPW
jgi:hypothetical protein